MDTPQLTLLALLVGAVIGAGIVWLVFVGLRMRDHARQIESTDIPDGTRAVLQAMDDAAIVVDGALSVIAASSAAEIFGLREGNNLHTEELRTLVRAARREPFPEPATMHLRRGVGFSDERLVVARARTISPKLVLLIVRDITERERVEQMRRDFVANTSHELKTPVGAVTLLAEAIESASDDPAQVRNFASRLSAEAGRLGQLTSRIMNLSRLQSEDELTEMRDVPVDEIVGGAISTHQVAAASAKVSVRRGGDRGIYVRGDAQVLTEAIGNLVANAIAYSPTGGDVGVGVRGGDGVVEIVVTDRGIGIAEGDQQRIFERFYRADQARSRSTGGTGLGLSIVKHAVQRHGGEVELWSRPGRGSTFTVRLPAVSAPMVDGAAKKKKKKKAKKTSAPLAPAAGRTKKGLS